MIYRNVGGDRLTADSYKELARALRGAGFKPGLLWPVTRGIENCSCYRFALMGKAFPGAWEKALALAGKTIPDREFWKLEKHCGKNRPKRYEKMRAAQLARRVDFWRRTYGSRKAGHCCNCGKSLPPRRRSWCGDECSRAAARRNWEENTPQGWASAVNIRADGLCQWPECGKPGAHAHHVKPIGDGGDPLDPDNGIYLCKEHHIWTHRQLSRKCKGLR